MPTAEVSIKVANKIRIINPVENGSNITSRKRALQFVRAGRAVFVGSSLMRFIDADPRNQAAARRAARRYDEVDRMMTKTEAANIPLVRPAKAIWEAMTDRSKSRSGRVIGDAASCAVDRLSGNRLFLYTQKTGVPVYVPLPPFVVEALEACPRISERYWFWTGVGSKETLAGNWRRTFRRLCEIAGVQGGHPHRFRDTLAVELLLEGVPIERVSILLGHSSVKITERHYAPWVRARQEQLESDLVRAWRNDPIAQAEMLRGDTAPQDRVGLRMVATYPRHEKGQAPN
jgi:integrase